MKKIVFIILILLFIILSIFKVNAGSLNFPLLGKTFYIDPGHGSKDKGTSHNNADEKTLNLDISKVLKQELENMGAAVFLTRDGDYDLSKPNALYRKKSDFDSRIALINNSKADMYLSIHQNYYKNAKYSGPQVFYSKVVNENIKIASSIQESLNKYTKNDREIKKVPKTYMYDKLNVPGVLIECGFISNPEELKKLKNEKYQKELSQSIITGIINYYK